ncbi:class I SAM-dependent DNA methyltransferase [Flavilitoribacter nigricans]|uniref:SAM-dependent methyltransferase n=1 Tax=Flavilitoribacter nigricans (strain ATCC 23147 / DSM 23189 / NBRC 102662 / NCIMB 1420 / SS-2) TaxID=1122177 RepID=A0A2D0N7E3_FLAN2|nr:class I SAM-dependent methyltransferase [Flavilitoribacter nigricans]PHN04306.1 SAM-dependent methyltransferase [Flavilitoribacter nigricans DSM 23189 = NBRC 102662]
MDKTKLAVEAFDDFADQYQEKYMDLELYNDSFDRFCTLIPQDDAAVLDLACGPGNITHYLLQQRPNWQILGTDLSENMLALARANNPKAQFQILDMRNTRNIGRKFEGVICGFGLPYLSREEAIKMIGDLSQVLVPGGILYLSTMEDDYQKSGLKGPSSGEGKKIYIHYHEEGYLRTALAENGFTILDTSRIDFPQPDGSTTVDLVLIARLG